MKGLQRSQGQSTCLLGQRLQHGLQDGRIAAAKGLTLALDTITHPLQIPVPLAPLLAFQRRPAALIILCLLLAPCGLFYTLHKVNSIGITAACSPAAEHGAV